MSNLQFKNSSEIAINNGVKIAVYGKSGLGKTMLAATCPNPIMLSVDRGTSSLSVNNIEKIYGNLPKDSYTINFPVCEVKTLKDFVDFLNFCQSSDEMKNYQTVVIDSMSSLADVLLNLAFALPINAKNKMLAYNDLKNQLGNLTQLIKWIDKNVYVIYEEVFTEEKQFVCGMPMRSLQGKQGYDYDLCLQLTKMNHEDIEYLGLNCKPEANNEVKQRIKKLDDFEYPHIGNIINKYIN